MQGESQSLQRSATSSLGAFGQIFQAPKPPSRWDGTSQAPGNIILILTPPFLWHLELIFVFVWAMVGLTYRKSQALPTPSSLIAKAFD